MSTDTTTSTFTAREARMIRAALRDRAGRLRDLARSPEYAGDYDRGERTRIRLEAIAYDRLSRDERLS